MDLKLHIPEAPHNHGHTLHYVLDAFEGVEAGMAMAGVHLSSMLVAVAAPIAGVAALFLALGNAQADAVNYLLADQIFSGFSRGVVLGADERKPAFVVSHFWKHGPVSNSVYPEHGKRLQAAYSRSLVGGYGQGKPLNRKQSGEFFADLFALMSVRPAVMFGPDTRAWSEQTWVSYYIECAAVFRRHHIEN